MEIIRPEQIVAAAVLRPTQLDSQIMRNMDRPHSTNIPICHFMSVRYFRTLMTTRSLSLCRCDKFRDVADGLLPPPNKDAESQTMSRMYEDLGMNAIDSQGHTLRFERNPIEEYRDLSAAVRDFVGCDLLD